MIWKSVLNEYPEVDCKCEVLIIKDNDDLVQHEAEFDIKRKMFLIYSNEKNKEEKAYATHWKEL